MSKEIRIGQVYKSILNNDVQMCIVSIDKNIIGYKLFTKYTDYDLVDITRYDVINLLRTRYKLIAQDYDIYLQNLRFFDKMTS